MKEGSSLLVQLYPITGALLPAVNLTSSKYVAILVSKGLPPVSLIPRPTHSDPGNVAIAPLLLPGNLTDTPITGCA